MISGVSNQVRSYQPQAIAPQAARAPQVRSAMAADSVAVRLPQAPVQAGGGSFDAAGLMDGIKKMFKSIGSFFVGLWNKITGKTPAQPAPVDENTKALAEQYKLQPTKANVDAFLAEVQGYASPGPDGFQTLGPGNPNTEAITQVQQLLKSWNYSVEPTGQYDAATQAAVRSFKQANGLHQTYKGTDGNFAVNEYLDYQTYQKMEAIVKGGGTIPTQPPTTTQPPASNNGTLNWQAIASQYKLYASQDNVNAFLAEVKSYQVADANGFRALGPGYPNQDEIKEVQGALAQVGFPVQANGTWDAATAKAVMDFKAKHGLHQNYRSADGNWAINEYADQATLQKLSSLLG